MELLPFSAEAREIKLGVYQHFKGNRYRVTGIARHSETLEELVIYQALDGEGDIWVRPVASFIGQAETEKGLVARFIYEGEN